MQRYYFHLLESGTRTPDTEGQLFDTLEAVRNEAIRTARAIMSGEIEAGRLCLLCHIEIADAEGRIVMTLPFRDAVVVTGL